MFFYHLKVYQNLDYKYLKLKAEQTTCIILFMLLWQLNLILGDLKCCPTKKFGYSLLPVLLISLTEFFSLTRPSLSEAKPWNTKKVELLIIILGINQDSSDGKADNYDAGPRVQSCLCQVKVMIFKWKPYSTRNVSWNCLSGNAPFCCLDSLKFESFQRQK